MSTTHTQDHLARLWQESSRDLAVAFFQRAVRQDLNLAELLKTLQYEEVGADLSTIRLGDILPSGRSAAPATQSAATGPAPAARQAMGPARGALRQKPARRRPHQTAQIKELLLDWVRKIPGGLKTPKLAEMLAAQGFEVDTATANLILKGMEDEGLIVGDQGRPRLWTGKKVGRLVPEPVIIRRGPEPAAAAAPPAAAPTPAVPTAPAANVNQEQPRNGHNGLLSQAEIHAAAAALRDRFFAKS